MSKLKTWLIPVLIFCLALALRVYHLPALFVFGTDEEYQAHYAMTLVRDFHPIWIGVSAADTGFYLGPYWTYFTAIWLKLSGGDPLLTGYVSAVIGSITAVAVYFLVSRIATRSTALYSSLLYASSPLIVYFDQKYWNPSTAPLLTVLILSCLTLTQKSAWYFVFSLILYALTWHVHLSLTPLILVIIVSYFQLKPHFTKVQIISGVFGILLVMLPLIIFDFNHDFSNLKTPYRMIQNSFSKNNFIAHNISIYGNTLSRLVWIEPGNSNANEIRNPCFPNAIPSPTIIPLVYLMVMSILIILWRYRLHPYGWALLLFSFAFIFYPSNTSSYYLLGAFPLIIATLAIIFSSFYLGRIGLVILLIFNLYTLFLTNPKYGYQNKQRIISTIKSALGNKSYSLTWDPVCYTQEGWRYLFQQKIGRSPYSSPVDGIFGWLYDPNEVKINQELTIDLTPDANGYVYKIITNP